MKTIYLFRHSAPDRQSTAANSRIPLTADGKAAAKRFWNKIRPSEAVAVYSSPYRRAYETAEAISKSIITDARLAERETGEQGTFTIQAWARQYTDCDFANTGGGGRFRTVRTRMTAAISCYSYANKGRHGCGGSIPCGYDMRLSSAILHHNRYGCR